MNENDEAYAYASEKQEIRSSLNEIDSLHRLVSGLKGSRVLVLCGQNILKNSNVVARVEAALDDLLVGRFEGVQPHSPVEAVEEGRDLALRVEPDVLLSVGGGSASTLARGVALAMSSEHDFTDFSFQFEPPNMIIPPVFPLPEVKVKVVAVTTTLGVAELGRGGGGFASRERTEKLQIAGDGRTTPRMIVIDGLALATTPESIQKSTAVGQLRIAIECVISKRHNPLSEAVGLHAIKIFDKEFATAWEQEPHKLLRFKAAGILASKAMLAAGPPGINTAICHHIGAISDVNHGEANAVLLPHTIRFNAIAGAEQLRLVASAFGIDESLRSPEHVGEEVAERVDSICRSLGIPRTLHELGVRHEDLDAIAVATLGDRSIASSPRSVQGKEEVLEILERAF